MGLERLPNPTWPVPPPSARKKAAVGPLMPIPVSALPVSRRSLAGLSWPEEGHPAFCCVVTEIPVDRSVVFELSGPSFEIISEFETFSLPVLFVYFQTLRDFRCVSLYTKPDQKYYTYIRDFNVFKRENNLNLALKASRSSSFEASLLKIKDIIASNRLQFPLSSVVKAQLAAFSKADLKNETDFYAVRALSMVVGSFTSHSSNSAFVEQPSVSAWY
jgi:hypothetical protein